MKKIDEIQDPTSCLNKATDDEIIFVLRAHDVAAHDTVRFWAAKRIGLGKNTISDPEIQSALREANRMEKTLR